MNSVLRDIRHTRITKGDIYTHDPFYDDGKRQYMRFARPVVITTSQWDSVSDCWENVIIEELESIHRPSEFYDFYIDPKLVDSKIISEYRECYPRDSPQCSIFNIMENRNLGYMDAMIIYIIEKRYRIVDTLPHYRLNGLLSIMLSDNIPITIQTMFNETWNTADYIDLLLPKKVRHFVNIEKLTCSCGHFKKNNTCDHIYIPVVKRVLLGKIGNTDLAGFFN